MDEYVATVVQSDGIRAVARTDCRGGGECTRFVDAIIYPERSGAGLAASEIIGIDVEMSGELTETLEIIRVRVAEGAPAAGRQLADVRFPTGTLVSSDDDGGRIAGSETTLDAGKRYVVAVEPNVAAEAMNPLRR